ncbi:HD domain-containing protein [Anaerocolumna sp.]|uniref:HD domain-containing protein n=1 Tax=Anaerocolumna sp. TaxID=2041569 RepID=UPI0028AA3CB2|nr:HD domain-containing protein [Anaerocolumna sp.]
MNKTCYKLLIVNELRRMCMHSRIMQMKQYPQHGKVTVYQHCIAVALMSCWIAWKFHLKVDYEALIRGALLHDYFLYDWHEHSAEHRLHGFHHPRKALVNASEDFKLTPIETNIILRHMFPLTPIPPVYLESWIVCVADKFCALRETLHLGDGALLELYWSNGL